MATIQEGNLSAPLYGSLFEGTKFWLSLQVPTRSHYRNIIQANGGVLVASEKEAEICLVDHLKKETPQNDKPLYSFTYIDACIKERKLVDLEDHLVIAKKKRAPSGSISQSKTAKPPKLGRNFFTQEDDAILIRAISVPGVKLSGNTVYQKLADEYPQHTMHSWRGRWVDHFSKIMPDGPIFQESSEPKPEPESPPMTRDTPKAIPPREKDGTDSDTESDSELFSSFTNADKKLLMDKAEEINLSDQPMKIFKLLSRQYPTHTRQEWSAYFYNVILPELRKLDNRAKVRQEERGAAASFRSSKSLQLQSPIQLESRSSESLKKDVKPRNPGPEQDSGSPVTSSTPKRRLPGNHGLTAPVMLDSEQVAAKLPQWRVVINPTTSSLATPGKTAPSAKPQTPQNQSSPQKRKHADDGQTPKVNQAVKRPRKRYASISEVPSTPNPSPRHKRQPSIELGGPFPTSAEKSVEDASALASKALVEVVKTPVKKAAGKSTKTGQVVKISETPAKSPKKPTSDKKPPSKSTPSKSTPAKSPETKTKTGLSYDNMSTQAIFNAEIDRDALSTEMTFDFPWLEDDEQVPSKLAKSTALVRIDTPSSKASGANVTESASKTDAETDKAGIEEMHRYLDYCEKKFGLSGSVVIQAVERTSGVKATIEILLKAISEGEEPADIPGIWSKEDDEVLMGSDSRKMKELSDRKGDAEITRRMEFLNLWNLA